MKKTAIITLKTDPETKMKAKETAQKLGFNLSTLLNAYLKDLVRSERVYFCTEETRELSDYAKRTIKESKEEYDDGKYSSFDNAKDALAFLDNIIEEGYEENTD
jgi:antitoxin component of RelBE/YafQ-DinJ toxin-antitoxin module